MASPLTHVEVASAAFFHVGCSHDELFQPEYKRCFPHCCPEHIDRSYCGTSLSVRVELAETLATETPPPSETLAVFARFEAGTDVSLRPGECVEVDKIAAGTQSDSNLEGQWVAGVLDRPSGLVTTIRTPGTPSDERKPLVFHLNGKPFSRWYYDWESGANKAQRLMKHVLKAYVVERCAVDVDGNFVSFTSRQAHTQLYRVAHVVTSPEFTVISYRRAPSEQCHTAARGSNIVAHQVWQGGISSAYREESPRGLKPGSGGGNSAYSHSCMLDDARTARYMPRMCTMADPSHNREHQRTSAFPAWPTDTDKILQDTLRWEHTNLAAVSVSKNLALLYSLLRWAPLSVYASFADELVHLIHHKLQEPLTTASQGVSKLNCFSKVLLDQAEADGKTAVASSSLRRDRNASGAPTVISSELEVLLHVLSQTTLWFFSKETRQWLRGFFRQYATSVLDKNEMRGCFLLFLHEVEDRMNTQVFATTSLRRLSNVAEEVITAVYSYEYFYSRRHRVRQLLSGQRFAGWSAFVAQMRDTYIRLSVPPGVPRPLIGRPGLNFSQVHPPRNAIESDWNAEWVLDVDEAVWKPTEQAMKAEDVNPFDSRDIAPISLFTLFEIVSHIVRLDVAIDLQLRELFIRSTQGVAGPLDSLRLVLDGKNRVFSLFPNGMSSSMKVGARGDYIGEIQAEQPDRLVVYLQIFNWSLDEEDPSYHVRMRIECWSSRRLCVSGDSLSTTALVSFTPEEVACFGELSLREKREAVDKAHRQLLKGNPTASMDAWKEHGRFRLSYHKV